MSDDNLTEYKFKQLFDGIAELRDAMKDGFDEIKRLLDTRLESRDATLADHEKRIQRQERKLERQAVINAILASFGGAGLTVAVGAVLWLVTG